MANGLFDRMTKEAIKELADGKETWRDVSPNVLIMAVFGMLANHLTHKIVRPMWWFVGIVATGLVWLIVSSIFGL